MICGFLDNDGVLHHCARYEHTSKAEELVDKFNMKRIEKFGLCEDVLLKNGWICIRTSDVYKAVRDYDGNILFITDKQQEFFEKHKEKFNDRQLADIEMLLKDFGKLYKYHMKDGENK